MAALGLEFILTNTKSLHQPHYDTVPLNANKIEKYNTHPVIYPIVKYVKNYLLNTMGYLMYTWE
jgi:hypothetical protein